MAAALLFALAAGQPASAQGVTLRLNSATSAQECANYAANGDAGDRAMSACDRAIAEGRLNRGNLITTLIHRGNLLLRHKNGAAALRDFDAVIALDARNAEARLNRGVALMVLDQPAPAVASITQALLLGVHEPHKAYYNRAAAREALGDMRGAYEDYSTALQIKPDWGPANVEMQRIARRRQEWLSAALANAQP